MNSIRFRFVALSFAGVAAALALAAWFFISLFSANLAARIDGELTGHMNRLAATLKFAPDGTLLRPENPADNRFLLAYGGLYWQIEDPAKKVTLRSPSLFDYALRLPEDIHEPGAIHRYRLPGPDGADVIVQERDIIVHAPEGERQLRLAVAIGASALDVATEEFAYAILPYMAALAIILALFSGLQITWGLRPLSRLTARVKDVQQRRAHRLDGIYPEELRPLVGEMNALLESQEKAIERARARASDLAHGLKTPLTVLANDALTLRERGDEKMADELDSLASTMQAHVDHELARARMAPSPGQRSSDADLKETIDQIVRTLSRIPKGERLGWTVTVPDGIALPVDPQDLRELLGNLFENAVKWARSAIVATADHVEGRWHLSIEDDGPGVPVDMMKSLTQRGVRLDHEKPGSGLGLAIVKEIADIYAIAIDFENKAAGGFRVTLAFPGDGSSSAARGPDDNA